uniref:Uncharacterized protein n=1 Tax=Plectus sambesii TaxID=2011161 RepID=A0A914US97_9BILA
MQCNDRVHKTVSSHRRPQQTKLDSKEQEDLFKYFVSYKPEACAAGQRIASSPTSSAPSSVKKLKYSVEDRGDSSNDLPPNPTPTPTPSPTPSSTSTAEEYVTSRRRKLIDECTDETKSEAELPKETKTHVRSKNKGELSVSKDSSISSCSTSSSLSRSRPVSPSGPIRSSTRLKKTRFDEESRNGSQKIVLPLEVTPRRPQVYDRAIATGEEMRCVADEDGLEHEYAIKTVTYAAMVHDDPDLPKSKRQPTIVTPRKRSCLPIVDINSSIEPLPYRSPLKRVQDLPATPRKIASLCAPSSASSRYSPRLDEANGNGGDGVTLIQDEADEIVDCPIEPEEESEDTSAIEQLMKSVREEDERNALIDAEQSDEVDDKEGAIGEVDDREAIALVQEQTDTEVVKALDVAMQDAASKDSIQFAELCDQLSQPTSSSTPTDDTKIRLEWAEEKTLTKSDAEEVDSYERPRRITKEKDSAPVKSENSNGEVSPPLTRRLRTRKSIAPVQSKPSRRGVRKNNSPTYKVVCEAPRKSLKPILRAARRKSMLARRTLNRSLQRPKKRLQWANSPVTLCVPITPRPGFIAGKVEMPTSPIKMTVRARPDLPVDPGATSDDDTVQEFMDPHDYDANYGRQRLSSDDILFAKETAAQSTDVAKRRRSSRRSKELYYRAEDSSSQSSTPTEKSESRPKRILRRLSCLPPPKRIVDYESTTESPSDSDAVDRKAAASRSTSDRLASDSSNEVSNRQNGRLEQEDGMNGDELPSEEPALDTAPVRRSTRRSSCVYARNRSADLQVAATSDQPGEREVKRPRRLSCRPDEKVAGGSASVEPMESLTVLKSTKPITPVEPKVFSIFNSRRSQLPSSSPTLATDEIDEADAEVSTTSDAEEKAKEEGLSSQELSSSQPLFPLFQRGRRSQILPAPEPEPPKKRGARKNTAVLNSDKNNASATSSPQPSLSLRRTRSQSKKLGADAPTKDSNGTTESAKKTQVRKKSSTTAKPQVIEEVDLTINSPPLSARSCVPTKPPPSPVVERVHSRWLGECDCAPFVELINLADSRDLRGAATIGGSGASLKMRPKMSEEIVIPAWSSMGLVKMTKTRVMNGCDESPLLSKSLVHKVVESSFTADQKAVFSRLRSVEGDPSALVWTEASRPRHASHMLGDAMAVARVENWLKTWKQRLSSGAKKT